MSILRSPEDGQAGLSGGPIENVQPMSPGEFAAFEARRRKLLKYVLESKLAGRESEFPTPEEAEGVDVAASMSRLRARMAEGPKGAEAVRSAFDAALQDIRGHDRYGPVRDAILRQLQDVQSTAGQSPHGKGPGAESSAEATLKRSVHKLRLLDHAAEVVRKRRDFKHKLASGTDLKLLEEEAADYAGSFKSRIAAMHGGGFAKAALEAAIHQSVAEGALQVKDYEDAAVIPADVAASLNDRVESELVRRQVAAESMERMRKALLLRMSNESALMNARSVADELSAEIRPLMDDLTGEGRPGEVEAAAPPRGDKPAQDAGPTRPKPAWEARSTPPPEKSRAIPQTQPATKDPLKGAEEPWMRDEPANIPDSMRHAPHRKPEPPLEKPKTLLSRLASAFSQKPLPKPTEPMSPIQEMDYDRLKAHFTAAHMRAYERELDGFEANTGKQLQTELRRRMAEAKMMEELRKAYPGNPNVRH